MSSSEQLAAASLDCYQQLIDFLTGLSAELGTAEKERLQEGNTRMLALQQKIRQADQHLLASLAERSPGASARLQELLQQRQQFMTSALHLSQTMASRAANVKSLLAHEISTLQTGQQALSGYRQQQPAAGQLLSNRF